MSVWVISIIWLSLGNLGVIYWLVRWLTDSTNPARHEYAIGAAMCSVLSSPAGAGLLIVGIVPKTGLSTRRRIVGFALVLFCIGANVIFDYLQVRYR